MTHLDDVWPLLVGVLGFTLGVVSFFQARIREMKECEKILEFATVQAKDALAAADRVLSNDETPPMLRRLVLEFLKIPTSEKLAAIFFSQLFDGQAARRRDINAPMNMSLREAGLRNPELAADVQTVIKGILLSTPLMHLNRASMIKAIRASTTDASAAIAKLPSLSDHGSLGNYGSDDLRGPYAAANHR